MIDPPAKPVLHADRCGMELCASPSVTGIAGCDRMLKFGTYTGRTAATWRRIDEPANQPADGESIEDFMRRLTREGNEHEALLVALLDRVRARQHRLIPEP